VKYLHKVTRPGSATDMRGFALVTLTGFTIFASARVYPR
jgi:hypothetical protein